MFGKLFGRPELFGGIGRALSSRNYRLYACGHVAHVVGWWGNRLGIGWLTWELTGSAAWLGVVAFVGMIPVSLVAPFGGAVADRYGHRRTAMIAGSCGATVTLSIGALALTGHLTIPLLLSLAVLQGSLFGMDFPARQALIPQLIKRENIPAAVAFNTTSFQVGAFVGPVIAGFMIAHYGAGSSVLLFGASTLWMVTMVSLIRHTPPHRSWPPEGSILSDIAEGFRYIAGHRSIRLLFLISFTSGVLIRPYVELLPGFAATVFHRGPEGLAALNAAAGLGALSSALVLLYRGRTRGLTSILTAGAVLSAIGLMLFTATALFPLALVILAATSLTLISVNVGAYSLIQHLAAPAMRGRVISVNAAIGAGAPALGALLLGGLADLVGLRPALAMGAALSLMIAIAVWTPLRRRRGEMESDTPV